MASRLFFFELSDDSVCEICGKRYIRWHFVRFEIAVVVQAWQVLTNDAR